MAGYDRVLRSNCRLTTERFVSVGLAAAFLVLSVPGCSRSSSTGSAGAGSNAASAAKPLSIGISFQELDNPYFVVMKEAAEEAAQSIGAELHLTDARHDVTKQISDIEDLIQKGIDILLINPTDSVGVETAVQSAKKAGIVVVAVDAR